MKKDMNFIDRFLYKLFIGFLLLLSVVLLDYFNIASYNKIKDEVSEHFNVLNLIKKINGNTKIIPINFNSEIVVSGDIYQNVEKLDEKYLINLGEYEAVENYSLGIVVKINKNKDSTYQVTIIGEDGITYIYDKLESLNCTLYKTIETKSIIGKASFDTEKNSNFFYFSTYKNNKFIDIYKK